jgi:hypothetical protein
LFGTSNIDFEYNRDRRAYRIRAKEEDITAWEKPLREQIKKAYDLMVGEG